MDLQQNYKITLWDEFKGPILLISITAFVMITLHNTFYTTLSIDNNKTSVRWNTLVSDEMKVQLAQTSEQIDVVAPEKSQNTLIHHHDVVQNISAEIRSQENSSEHQNDYVVINSDVSVSAAEFYHPKLATVLSGNAISGYLEVQNGEVKGLSVNINSDKANDIGILMISMGESQLQGNIFVYEIDGQNYTGTIYPTSVNEYMVSFVNGPWNGARVKFTSQEQQEAPAESVADGSEQIFDQGSYQTPETDMTSREWASEQEQVESTEVTIDTSSEGNIIMTQEN